MPPANIYSKWVNPLYYWYHLLCSSYSIPRSSFNTNLFRRILNVQLLWASFDLPKQAVQAHSPQPANLRGYGCCSCSSCCNADELPTHVCSRWVCNYILVSFGVIWLQLSWFWYHMTTCNLATGTIVTAVYFGSVCDYNSQCGVFIIFSVAMPSPQFPGTFLFPPSTPTGQLIAPISLPGVCVTCMCTCWCYMHMCIVWMCTYCGDIVLLYLQN